MCPPNHILAAVTLHIAVLLCLYKVCDSSQVSLYNALITQCFRMPSPWENAERGRQGCKQDFSVVITHGANFLSLPPTVLFKEIFSYIYYVVCHLNITDTISGLFTIDA